ncbi:MAG: hypothetical protein FH762_05585 [Firmicutes bacterium]|nr:hypothetical protein [Bacillota bacterium]
MLENLSEKIIKASNKDRQALIGFDGFVDKIYHPVKSKNKSKKEYYQEIQEFGNRLIRAAGLSCDIDIDLMTIKPGGNAPIMANALGCLDLKTTAIIPVTEYERLFQDYMSENTSIISIGEPALSFVLEFQDGKVMLGDTHSFKKINWKSIQDRAGALIPDKLNEYQLLGLTNWSHFNQMSAIWQNILLEVEKYCFKQKSLLFVDLADCQGRTTVDILDMLLLLKKFRKYYQVILGLNVNEAVDIGKKVCQGKNELFNIGNYLLEQGYIDEIVIHPVAKALFLNEHQKAMISIPKIEKPVITTGGGDNFNAGYCWAKIHDFNSLEATVIGTLTASLYVKTGQSPNRKELVAYLEKIKPEIIINNKGAE